mmetsp:Transcript_8554/g.26774  ORF Transcript_8554/g.26774 Transcript_8554/m.26774 type:complete len:226 (+) Transcript_8554:1415-2092(+)
MDLRPRPSAHGIRRLCHLPRHLDRHGERLRARPRAQRRRLQRRDVAPPPNARVRAHQASRPPSRDASLPHTSQAPALRSREFHTNHGILQPRVGFVRRARHGRRIRLPPQTPTHHRHCLGPLQDARSDPPPLGRPARHRRHPEIFQAAPPQGEHPPLRLCPLRRSNVPNRQPQPEPPLQRPRSLLRTRLQHFLPHLRVAPCLALSLIAAAIRGNRRRSPLGPHLA